MEPIRTQVATPQPAAAPASAKVAKIKKPQGKKIVITLVILLLVVAIGLLGWKYTEQQAKLKKLSNPTEAAKVETDSLVKKVNEIVELPKDETPTVATVVDAGKLKSQAFFANAANNDKVLMYTKAKKAYLYRPSTDKLIEVAPINIDQPTTSTTPTKK